MGIWEGLGRHRTREDAAEADLYKLVIRDLSTGSIIRQHKTTDYNGNFLRQAKTTSSKSPASTIMESAFENTKQYELTNLGKDFVHYAINDLPIKIEFNPEVFQGV